MKVLESLTAAVLAWSFGMAAPAAAATYIFDVNVTSRSGGSGTFVPFTFQQSWSIAVPAGTGTIATTAGGSGNFATVMQFGVISESAGVTASPMRDELLAIAAPITTINSTVYGSETFIRYAGPYPAYTDYNLSLGSLGQYYLNAGANSVATKYQLSLDVQEGAAQEAAFRSLTAFNEAGLAQLFAAGPLTFTESGERLFGSSLTLQARTMYSGTATLRQFVADPSNVPEPATWTTMLVGFGALGLSMRRRRGSATASRA